MPVHFDWRSLQQYVLAALGIVSLLALGIIATVGRLGLGSPSSDKVANVPDGNVIFNQDCGPAWDTACLPANSHNDLT